MAKQQQVVIPALPQAEPINRRMPVEEAESFLKAAGWQHDGTNDKGETTWADPAGMGPKSGTKVVGARLENKDGGEPTEIKQTMCGPAPWSYPMMEAVQMQRTRDRAAKKAEEAKKEPAAA